MGEELRYVQMSKWSKHVSDNRGHETKQQTRLHVAKAEDNVYPQKS